MVRRQEVMEIFSELTKETWRQIIEIKVSVWFKYQHSMFRCTCMCIFTYIHVYSTCRYSINILYSILQYKWWWWISAADFEYILLFVVLYFTNPNPVCQSEKKQNWNCQNHKLTFQNKRFLTDASFQYSKSCSTVPT